MRLATKLIFRGALAQKRSSTIGRVYLGTRQFIYREVMYLNKLAG